MSLYFLRLGILCLCGACLGISSRFFNTEEITSNHPLFAATLMMDAVIFIIACIMVVLILRARKHPEKYGADAQISADKFAKVMILLVLSLGSAALCIWLGRLVLAGRFVLACRILSLSLAGLAVSVFLVERIIGGVQKKKMSRMSVREIQQYVLNHRDEAEKKFAEKEKLLCRMNRLFDLQDLLIALIGAGAAFLFGGVGPVWDWFYVPFGILCAVLILSSLLSVRLPFSRKARPKDDSVLKKADFPELFATAERAMEALGVKGNFAINVVDGAGAGIEHSGDYYILQLGQILLSILSKEELFNVLLHEFAHVTGKNSKVNRLAELKIRFAEPKGVPFADLLFRNTHTLYPFFFFHHQMYIFAGSLALEYASDLAAAEHGDAKAFISALFKMKYYEFYAWEYTAYDHPPLFAAKTPEEVAAATDDVQLFLSRLAERKSFWHELILKELPGRTDSHPTARMRAEALGFADTDILPADHDESYAREVEQAVAHFRKQFIDSLSPQFKSLRKEYYLDYMERVANWDNEGKPLDPINYPDTLGDLKALGRITDALELCDRALKETEISTQGHAACFVKGTLLLHRFDEAGVELLYKAIENNTNYIDEGLPVLGYYFCQTGRTEELEEYREKALKKTEEQSDLYSKMEYLAPEDNLVPESLPEGRLDDILNYIKSISDNCVAEVFLVRKVITDEFFCSPFVIRFNKTAPEEKRFKIMHLIFNYLDNCPYDWQYALFDYDEVPKTHQAIKSVEGSSVCRFE